MKIFHSITRKALFALACVLPLLAYGENPRALDQENSKLSFPQFSQNTQYHTQNSKLLHHRQLNLKDHQNLQYDRESHNRYAGNYEIESKNGYPAPDYNCSQPCDPCQEPCGSNGFWDSAKTAIIIGVAAIGGGFIGAELAGGKKGSRGHDGDDGDDGAEGPEGPPGPGFIADVGQTLSFRLTALFPAVPNGAVSALPFVTSPNGVTFEGPAVVTPTSGGSVVFSAIVVPNPVFGFYNFGLSITNTSTTVLTGITLNTSLVTASRDASSTVELTPVAGVTIAPGESQVSNTFTYDSANVP